MKKKCSIIISTVMFLNIFFAGMYSGMVVKAETLQETVQAVNSSTTVDAMNTPAPVTKIMSFGTGNNGNIRVVEFDITPSAGNIDAVIGFSSDSVTPLGVNDFSVGIRLNSEGAFDAINGEGYSTVGTATYSAGIKYHVKVMTNLSGKTYDAWITPSGGNPVVIAKDFRFSTTAQAMRDIGGLYL
jgi:hypothetical protein